MTNEQIKATIVKALENDWTYTKQEDGTFSFEYYIDCSEDLSNIARCVLGAGNYKREDVVEYLYDTDYFDNFWDYADLIEEGFFTEIVKGGLILDDDEDNTAHEIYYDIVHMDYNNVIDAITNEAQDLIQNEVPEEFHDNEKLMQFIVDNLTEYTRYNAYEANQYDVFTDVSFHTLDTVEKLVEDFRDSLKEAHYDTIVDMYYEQSEVVSEEMQELIDSEENDYDESITDHFIDSLSNEQVTELYIGYIDGGSTFEIDGVTYYTDAMV